MINKRALPEFENWRMLFEEQHLGDCDLIRKNKIFRRITMKNLIIRTETSDDYAIVENLTREAFWNVYRPGCVEHYVLHCFRSLPEFIPQLSLVAEAEGLILGHIMYSRASITCDDGSCLPIVIFGPLSVAPEHQRRGIGSALVRHSLALAKSLGCGAVAITGSSAYYGRFGFIPSQSKGIFYDGLPRSEPTPFFMVKELTVGYLAGITGTYADPPGYFVRDEDVDAFDARFPLKEKLKLPGQLA